MVFLEVNLQGVVVDKVLLLPCLVAPITDMAAFVLVATVRVQLIVAVEALSTEAAFWMTLEAALIDGTRVVVAELLVPAKLVGGEELVLVSEDLFVAGAEVAVRVSVRSTTKEQHAYHMTF